MRHCYLCDSGIAGSGHRRNVGTGRSNRVSFGRRVSTSTTRRSGLRTVCAGCAAQLDAQARFQAKVGTAVAAAVVLFVVYVSVTSHSSGNVSAATVTETASSTITDVGTSTNPVAPAADDSAGQFPTGGQVPGLSSAQTTAAKPKAAATPNDVVVVASSPHVRWRHQTNAGTRWSLGVADPEHPTLSINLGDANVATIVVAREFLNLDAAGMATRVDYLKGEIAKDFGMQSAKYSFLRDGQLRAYP